MESGTMRWGERREKELGECYNQSLALYLWRR